MLIEQAIFASAATGRTKGYQLVGRSAGLSEDDARELAVWGPSHDSLLEDPPATTSVNFHLLSGGAYGVSRTTAAGAEFSGRGGAGVYTQFLVVPPEVLRRFANNPFAVLRAATASGAMRVYEKIPEALDPLRLAGSASVVDLPLLAQLARNPGPHAMATLIQTALASDRLAVFAEARIEHLVAGLLSALPVECRPQFSFSTGLRVSQVRPVRISALSADRASWRSVAGQGVTLLRLNPTDEPDVLCWEGWAGFVARLLASGKLSALAAELEQARPGLKAGDLDALAAQLQTHLPTELAENSKPPEGDAREPEALPSVTSEARPRVFAAMRADAAHVDRDVARELAHDSAASHTAELEAPLSEPEPDALQLLERIDDLVFTAISGDQRALEELQVLWPAAVAELDRELIEQSREQYLRCALSIWNECVEGDVKRPEHAVPAIDVLCILFDE